MIKSLALCTFLVLALPAHAAQTGTIPSMPGIDAPELAALGPHAVGFRSLTLVHRAQPDVEARASATGACRCAIGS